MVTLAEHATATDFIVDQVIFREGDLANRCYLILYGCVALEASVPDGATRVIDRLGPGEVLGWSWMFPPFRWHFSARALTPTKAIFVYGSRLLGCCEGDPVLGYELAKRMAAVAIGRLQSAQSQLAGTAAAGRPEQGSNCAARAASTASPFAPADRSGQSRNNSTHFGRHNATRPWPSLMRANQLPSMIAQPQWSQFSVVSIAQVASKFLLAPSHLSLVGNGSRPLVIGWPDCAISWRCPEATHKNLSVFVKKF